MSEFLFVGAHILVLVRLRERMLGVVWHHYLWRWCPLMYNRECLLWKRSWNVKVSPECRKLIDSILLLFMFLDEILQWVQYEKVTYWYTRNYSLTGCAVLSIPMFCLRSMCPLSTPVACVQYIRPPFSRYSIPETYPIIHKQKTFRLCKIIWNVALSVRTTKYWIRIPQKKGHPMTCLCRHRGEAEVQLLPFAIRH